MTRTVLTFLMISAVQMIGGTGRAKAASVSEYYVYVGTYTGPQSKGIYAFRFRPADGSLTPLGLAAETVNPSFLVVDASGKFAYAANESKQGAVSAFAIEPGGKLKFINEESTRGSGPCYVSLDRSGKYLLAANYDSGSVAVLPILPDGRVGEASAFVQHRGSSVNHERQEGPHAHWFETSPDNRFALAVDLGLDEVLVYRFDAAKGTLAANDPPFAKIKPGSGPRHLAFTPNGRFAYVVNEMGNQVTAFRYDAKRGALSQIQEISALPDDFHGVSYLGEVAVDAAGRFLYASNRGHDSIAVFSIDPKSGKLAAVGRIPTQGKFPRHFAIDPTGSYMFVANQNSGNVVLFRVNRRPVRLTAAGQSLTIASPSCVAFARVRE